MSAITHSKRPCFVLVFASIVLLVEGRSFSIDGHVTHGVNNFNSEPLVNWSSSSLIFSSFPAGVGPFNIPLAQTPTYSLLSSGITDRAPPFAFDDSADPQVVGQPYLSEAADANITLAEWNTAAARMSGVCGDGTAKVRIELQDVLANGLFTLWDVGVLSPLTPNETVSVGPFGGMPNVLASDERGRASMVRKLNYCPFDKCEGAARCTLSVCVNYHFDHVVYGGAPTLDFAGLAPGHVAANQVALYPNGDFLIAPQNKVRSWKARR